MWLSGGTWYIRLVVGLGDREGLFHPGRFCDLEMYDFFKMQFLLRR